MVYGSVENVLKGNCVEEKNVIFLVLNKNVNVPVIAVNQTIVFCVILKMSATEFVQLRAESNFIFVRVFMQRNFDIVRKKKFSKDEFRDLLKSDFLQVSSRGPRGRIDSGLGGSKPNLSIAGGGSERSVFGGVACCCETVLQVRNVR